MISLMNYITLEIYSYFLNGTPFARKMFEKFRFSNLQVQ